MYNSVSSETCKEREEFSGEVLNWETAIADAKKMLIAATGDRAKRLRRAISVFVENVRRGDPWPGSVTQ